MMMFGRQHDGAEPSGTDIVPATQQHAPLGHGWLWFVGIALSVAIMGLHPYVGTACLAMGLRVQSERFGARGGALGTGIAILVLVVWAGVWGISSTLAALPLVGIAVVLVALMSKRRASVTAVSLVVVGFTALIMAFDAVSAALAGSNLADAATSLLMETAKYAAGEGIEARLTLTSMEPVIASLWPMMYVLTIVIDVAVAGLGSFLGSFQHAGAQEASSPFEARVRVPQISRFDAPLWAVGVLALAVLGLAVSLTGVFEPQLLRTASLTLFLSVRFIFMIQGLGVVLGLVSRWHVGCFGQAAIIMIAAWLEMMFVMSIIGLIDVWANFRKLPRNGSRTEAHS